ncbi:MAG: DUF262 domain-containing protein [Flexistipes sinusarabici]|uniref:DUF262 domain-containing protein n=1 Tax=Flexistipes sinusarabici TaxID=2352 RepID=A0A5D0MMN3_FLESI|nr:DUF262 domain-containing HNH endonuclease family protein [Flexistipes sinusarabici]TYB32721.1 MAG: DUF262 domain-containing protein [Flexistipes sinusarabici]
MINNTSVNGLSVEKLFSKDNSNFEQFYEIPPYQRDFAWGKEQWENLFDDILENDSGYFIGSLICINNKKDNPERYEVIDGQQRLTTLSILMIAIYDYIKKYHKNHEDEKILDLTANHHKAIAFIELKKAIVYRGEESEELKLSLSIINDNDKDYKYLCYEKELIGYQTSPSYFGNRRIKKCFSFFTDKLNNLENIDKVFNFLKKLNDTMLVRIDVIDSSSAFVLFESINNRGIPLTPIDLIKNKMIKSLALAPQSQYPERTNKIWKEIVDNIEKYEDQVRYLRHYFHSFKKDPKINVKGYYKATKSNILKIYEEIIKKDPNFILDDLKKKSEIYKNFIVPDNLERYKNDDQLNSYRKYKGILNNLLILKVAPAYALLLHLFSKHPNYDWSNVLKLIEKWFLRRNLTDFPASNRLDQIFIECIEDIYESNPEDVFKKIKNVLTKDTYCLSDPDFKYFLETNNIYDRNAAATKYLLVKLENSLRDPREEHTDFWISQSTSNKSVWTVEHILPQNPREGSDWYEFFEDKEDMEKSLHKLGNLTLTGYNSSLSNGSFKEKCEAADGGLRQGNVKINDYIDFSNGYVWNEDAIRRRSEKLSQKAREILALNTG